MTPEQLAKCGTEHGHQTALMCWAHQNLELYPELVWLFAIPNGGQRQAIVAARLKVEGVRSGVSDLMLPTARRGYHGFFLEMKKPKGKESDSQKQFGAHLGKQGYLYGCFDHWTKARDALLWYLERQF